MATKKDSSAGLPRGQTPPKWDGPEDARKSKEAAKYPNVWTRKTRSGHVITLDDSKDNESITIQHRSGAMIQFMPDGAVQFVANKGQYVNIFGESRVKITGAQDITVEGDASFKVKGGHNMTVDGDSTLAIKGKYTVTAQSMNTTIAEQMDTVAGSKTEKIDGSSTTQVAGAASIVSKGGMTLGSTGDSVGIGSGKNLGLAAKGTLSTQSIGKTSIKATGDVAVDGARIYNNSNQSETAVDQVVPAKIPESPKEPAAPAVDPNALIS